jgi:putative transposase
MPEYRRMFQPGAVFFFTVVTHHRRPVFRSDLAIRCLGDALRAVRKDMPFDMLAYVILHDHIHCLWALPEGDADFSARWSSVNRLFTRRWLALNGRESAVSASRTKHRERGVWQRRFWEHTIRDEDDMIRHVDYIHHNPVKHGLAAFPHTWPHSSFDRWVKMKHYPPDWQCVCNNRVVEPVDFTAIEKTAME